MRLVAGDWCHQGWDVDSSEAKYVRLYSPSAGRQLTKGYDGSTADADTKLGRLERAIVRLLPAAVRAFTWLGDPTSRLVKVFPWLRLYLALAL